ncbi:nickel transporter permease [Fuscibacter oryzae]|uniref:ABC transporter permease n=1 Tax=Fuscibacter oryzae TaxID=2803939 RepID=A0A8J7MVS9_9RHOB|nr:nickel transporter permease [Fuscibacter oryzae]MBL4928504.1 ABC transporter permease [Fuscibacter oryzae]
MTTLTAWLRDPSPTSRRQARLGQAYLAWLRLKRNRLAMIGLAIVALLIIVAALAPWIAPHDPITQALRERLQPPLTPGHILGTDDFGRDILSRLIVGSRITLFIIALVAVTAPVFGLIIGTVAGYFGGWTDEILMRITDIFLAFPKLILALALVAVLGPGMENAVLAIAITSWPPYARVARAETLTVRNSDYIAAVRLQGAGAARIIWGHIMPMCIPSVIIRVTLDMAGVILIAAGLGFLGLGVQPPMPEWGAMISAGRKYLFEQWWVATMPGMAIFIVSLGFNLLGDGLRDVLDPRNSGK